MPPSNSNKDGHSEPSPIQSQASASVTNDNAGLSQPTVPNDISVPVATQPTPSINPASTVAQTKPDKPAKLGRKLFLIVIIFVLLVAASATSYIFGKRNERIVYRPPEQPLISLPPEATIMNECVKGAGKQYVIPKDLPTGPIYDVHNGKVIAVEYNYKAVTLLAEPTKLSDTIMPLTKNYKIDHFTTSVAETKKSSLTLSEVQNLPIHVIFYVVPQAEADSITCSNSKAP